MIQIYHNPRCGKSRQCVAFFDKTGQEFEIIKYLESIPTFDELKNIIEKLGIAPIELVRQKEKIWVENFKNKTMTSDEIIQAMLANPILIERPIVINADNAIIGRELEKLNTIL